MRQTVTNERLLFCRYMHSAKIKTNWSHASQIYIGVIIILSLKTQTLCDVLIGRELNENHPYCYRTTGHFITNPLASDKRLSSDLLWRKILDSCCGLQVWSLRRISRKKMQKLESSAGKFTHTKSKVGVKIRLIRRFRELCSAISSAQEGKPGTIYLVKSLIISCLRRTNVHAFHDCSCDLAPHFLPLYLCGQIKRHFLCCFVAY